MKFAPFPVLSTDRLILRQTTHADTDAVYFLRTDERVNKHINRPSPATTEEATAFIDRVNRQTSNDESIYWVITLKPSNRMIGSVSLWHFSSDQKEAETGYDLHPDFHGQGIMTEALQAILAFGFNQLKLEHIVAYTNQKNEHSLRLLNRNKFQLIDNRHDEDDPENVVYGLRDIAFHSGIGV